MKRCKKTLQFTKNKKVIKELIYKYFFKFSATFHTLTNYKSKIILFLSDCLILVDIKRKKRYNIHTKR